MSEAKFTKGPWQFTPAGPADSEGYGVCSLWGEPGSEEMNANNHLIAAAPEMYDVIIAMLEQFDAEETCHNEYDYIVIRGAKKALAKARGEA